MHTCDIHQYTYTYTHLCFISHSVWLKRTITTHAHKAIPATLTVPSRIVGWSAVAYIFQLTSIERSCASHVFRASYCRCELWVDGATFLFGVQVKFRFCLYAFEFLYRHITILSPEQYLWPLLWKHRRDIKWLSTRAHKYLDIKYNMQGVGAQRTMGY